MRGLNKAILIGTVDESPRLHGAGGRSRLTLRVRTVEAYTDEGGVERERRAWHDVVVWGRLGESLAPHLARGTAVALEGRIVNTSWDGADGRRRWRTEIHASEIVLMGRSANDGAARHERSDRPGRPEPAEDGDRDAA